MIFDQAASLTRQLDRVRPDLWQLGSAELAPVVEVLGSLLRVVEAAMTGVTAEAVDRGVVQGSRCAGTTAGVRERAGIAEPGRAHAVATVAEATLEPGTEPLADAVWGGGVSVGVAHTLLKESLTVLPVLPGAEREQVLGYYLQHAEKLNASGRGRATSRALRQLTRQVMARFGEDTLDREDERAKECSTLTERQLPTGLVRFQVDLNQPDAARLRTALEGLSAPARGQDEQGRSIRDPRTPGRRRADALLELVERAQAADARATAGGCGLAGATTLLVTLDHRTLQDELARRGVGGVRRAGWGRGLPGPARDAGPTAHGSAFDGTVLTPTQLRQAACDARVVPAVLGSDGAPLEIGRADRNATGAQRGFLALRDGGCTFPGCDRPPGWCHAHHVVHWADGGPTDVDNLALLCERHHTVVHRDGLTGTFADGRWHWHEEEREGAGPPELGT
ncbi:HNH endonuclease signature motif containing protein [Kytococcus sp. Marseille-QA3725]